MALGTSPAAVPGEEQIVDAIRLDDAWALVEEFAGLVRESSTAEELQAVHAITRRLEAWGIPHALHRPLTLISLPRAASLTVDGRRYFAKTPSMARSTGPDGERAPLVYEPSNFARDVNEIFSAARGSGDVAGKFVITEGLPMAGKVADLERRDAAGVVFISPGDRIHEGICTSIWGSPDLTSYARKPRIPVVSVSQQDGVELVSRLAQDEANAVIVAEHDEGWVPIPVLVARIEGRSEPERFVLVHGHIDSWHVGIGDNATGDATLLELARVLGQQRDKLERSVWIAWWSGHSHGRYAGSTWFADAFALELERNCICHVNCDSPGCRDADAFEDACWMAEVEDLAREAIRDFSGQPAQGQPPLRAGDISFNNLGISTFFMLSSMPAELRAQKGYYAVGGCGGNIEWHTEADTLEIADRERLLRDMKLYAGAVFRAATRPVHPLDFRVTVDQIEERLADYRGQLGELVELDSTEAALHELRAALERLATRARQIGSIEQARPVNDALLAIARALVPVLYSRDGRYRQDPALYIPVLPDFAAAAEAVGTVPDGVLRTELVRARNRLERALADAAASARAAATAAAAQEIARR